MADTALDNGTPTKEVVQDATSTRASGDGEEEKKKNARPERTATFQDYVRVFKYANAWDFGAYVAAIIASIGAGVTMPLMTVLFGRFTNQVSDLNSGTASASSLTSNFNELS